jgi:hypothetical protein
MAQSRRRFSVWACVLGAATLVVGIGVATGAKLKTTFASREVPIDTTGSATAKCPSGVKVVSGGHDVANFEIYDTDAVVMNRANKGNAAGPLRR